MVDPEGTTTYTYDAWNLLSSLQNPQGERTPFTGVRPEGNRRDATGNLQVNNAAGSRTTYSWDIEDRGTLAEQEENR
jgi:YD repeat-containing protein